MKDNKKRYCFLLEEEYSEWLDEIRRFYNDENEFGIVFSRSQVIQVLIVREYARFKAEQAKK